MFVGAMLQLWKFSNKIFFSKMPQIQFLNMCILCNKFNVKRSEAMQECWRVISNLKEKKDETLINMQISTYIHSHTHKQFTNMRQKRWKSKINNWNAVIDIMRWLFIDCFNVGWVDLHVHVCVCVYWNLYLYFFYIFFIYLWIQDRKF